MTRPDILSGALLDECALTMEELAHACRTDIEWVRSHVETEVLTCTGKTPTPRFSSRDLQRARRIRALERSFDADPMLAAMVADLIDELDRLRAQMRRAGVRSE